MIDIYKTWVDSPASTGSASTPSSTWTWSSGSSSGRRSRATRRRRQRRLLHVRRGLRHRPALMSRVHDHGGLQATVDFGFQGSGVNFAKGKPRRAARLLRPRRLLHRRRLQRVLAADVPRQPRHGPRRQLPAAGRRRRRSCSRVRARPLAHVPHPRPARRLLRRRAGLLGPHDVVGGIGDQRAREDMFPSKVALLQRHRRPDRDDATTAQANFDTAPAVPAHRRPGRACGRSTRPSPTVRRCTATRRRTRASSPSAGWTRRQVEYVVAVNNATTAQSATFDTYQPARGTLKGIWPASAPRNLRTTRRGGSRSTVRPCRPSVYRATAPCGPTASRRSRRSRPPATRASSGSRRGRRDRPGWRLHPGDLRLASGRRHRLAAARHRRQRAVPGLPRRAGLAEGTPVEYRAVARDHDGDLGVVSTNASSDSPNRRPTGCRPRPDHPADRRVGAGQPRQRDRLRGRLETRPATRRPADARATTRSGRGRSARRPGSTPSRRPSTGRGTRTTAPVATATGPTSPTAPTAARSTSTSTTARSG